MDMITIGAIDIGSNAIRLLIYYVEGDKRFKKATFIRIPVRLGEDVFTTHRIGDEKREQLCDAMKSFTHQLKVFKVEKYRACATSAMRDAENGLEIVDYIYQNTGIKIDIISGEEEAKTIFEAGDFAGLMGSEKSYLYVDVGGGSTEISIYSSNKRIGSESFQLGTVRMVSNAVDKGELYRFHEWVEEVSAKYNPQTIIGSGGNINKIYNLLKKKGGEPIYYNEINDMYEDLNGLTIEERMAKYDINAHRAEVIMPALKIFLTIANIATIDEILSPNIGLIDGVISKLYKENFLINLIK